MKYKRKILFLIIALIVIGLLSSCSKLKITEQMQQGIDAYTEAVSKSETKESGDVEIITVVDDNAIEFVHNESLIEYEYTVSDGKVNFIRSDYLNGQKILQYDCDGSTVSCLDLQTGEKTDKTQENSAYLSAQTNPLITLQLFRVDSNKKINTNQMTDIQYNPTPDKDGYTTVQFTLNDSTVTDILGYNKVKGIVRKSAGHTRTYYLDSQGYIAKIEIYSNQIIYNNGKEGSYTTEMTVNCK